jgi:hypothetical protein
MGMLTRTSLACASTLLVVASACSYEVEPSGLRGRTTVRSATASAPTEDAGSASPATGTATSPTTSTPVTPPTTPTTDDGPGPPPPGCGAISKDADGFFTRTTAKGAYVGIVPHDYAGQPTRLIVGLHGCGDNPYNFATWAVSPATTRATQDWIAISVGGETGGGKCWQQSDAAVVLAAIDDVSRCFYVHKHQVVLAGFSSGGELAYGMGLTNASRFAGILAENTSLSAAGNPTTLLAGASWKLPIAHTAHTGDTVFPLATVHADWTTIDAAGFPLQHRETSGTHDGVGVDWSDWLLPIGKTWTSP